MLWSKDMMHHYVSQNEKNERTLIDKLAMKALMQFAVFVIEGNSRPGGLCPAILALRDGSRPARTIQLPLQLEQGRQIEGVKEELARNLSWREFASGLRCRNEWKKMRHLSELRALFSGSTVLVMHTKTKQVKGAFKFSCIQRELHFNALLTQDILIFHVSSRSRSRQWIKHFRQLNEIARSREELNT